MNVLLYEIGTKSVHYDLFCIKIMDGLKNERRIILTEITEISIWRRKDELGDASRLLEVASTLNESRNT